MVTKLKIIALILLIVIEIVGCIGEKREIPTNSVSIGTPSGYKVEYWPVTENDTAYIMIVVRGGTEFMEIIPLDPTITIHQGRGAALRRGCEGCVWAGNDYYRYI